MASSEQLLSCLFLLDVQCGFRKDVRPTIMSRCFSCKEYKRFNDTMDKEEGDFWRFEAKIRKQGGYLPADLR